MSLTVLDYFVTIGACALSLAMLLWRRANTNKLPLPPGPPRWPLIGCLPSMPNDENWKVFTQWGKNYGDVVHARVINQDIIILNSYEAAVELLERRSAIYSGRPHLVMANELVGWKRTLGLMQYGERLRHTRKLLHEGMSIKAMQELWPIQEEEAVKFVQRLLDTPGELIQHIRQTSGATVIKLTYGYDVKDRNDRFIRLADEAMDIFSITTTPGAFLVDTFPPLRYIPWAPFKTKAKAWSKVLRDFVELPMRLVQDRMENGNAEPCLTTRWLEREVKPEEQSAETVENNELLIKWAAMSLYGGGADTTVSAVSSFFAAMAHYPLIQAGAQAEIDRVVGTDRLPTYSDRGSLPYVEALYKEVLRWHPVTPLGVPHALDTGDDDEYRGMRIPKGSTVVANIWTMLQDPIIYHNPTTFNPERFMGPSECVEQNPEDMVFGFGRRRCPGMNVAHSSVWLSIALTLSAYNITPAKGPDGEPALPDLHYSNGTISHPAPFQCTITPRSEKAITLVKDALIV